MPEGDQQQLRRVVHAHLLRVLVTAAADDHRHIRLLEHAGIILGEEVVAVLECLASKSFDDDIRKAALLKEIDILLDKLDAPARAIYTYTRLLAMDPDDAQLLDKIESKN